MSEPVPTEIKSLRRTLLILWFAFVWTLAAYGIVLLVVETQPREAGALPAVMLGLAVLTATAVVYIRAGLLGRLLSKPTPLTTEQWTRLRVYYILCFALAESVALFGLVLSLLGGGLSEVAPYFAASILLFLICFPRLPA